MTQPPRPDWPVAFFDDDYLKIYRPQFTEARTRQEIDFIVGALGVVPGARVLDLACGFGRHAVGMAQRGFRMTGVDFNPRYLEIGAENANAAGVTVEWLAADMRSLAFPEPFDAGYSFFTSFGYYSDHENEQVLLNMANALAPGGRFLLDVMNRDWLLTHPQQRTWTQREDRALLMEEVQLDLRRSRVISRQMLIQPEGGVQVTKEFDLRSYTCAELSALMARNGLQVMDVFGGADRSEYSTESRRLVLVAERGAEAGAP
jgi:SAM-dependent methyltransferase